MRRGSECLTYAELVFCDTVTESHGTLRLLGSRLGDRGWGLIHHLQRAVPYLLCISGLSPALAVQPRLLS
jgi:hypothetical protein